ncbi:alpha/beta hydrolase family protein [Aliikangiella maris]|uniref:S9 family peptidase n=2 Tax=Aliikangiella maris TaxID=3162458 RepID=A0ABV3MUR1_9GAMM
MKKSIQWIAASSLLFSIHAGAKSIPLEPFSVLPVKSLYAVNFAAQDFSDVAQVNLINSIRQSLNQQTQLTLFGERQQWQPFNQIKQSASKNETQSTASYVFRVGLSTERFAQGTLKVEGIDKVAVFLNGEKLSGTSQYQLDLVNGDYRLLMVASGIKDWQKVNFDWQEKHQLAGKSDVENDSANLNDANKAENEPVDTSDNAASESTTSESNWVTFNDDSRKQRLNAHQMYDSEVTSQTSLSPDGEMLLISKRHYTPSKGDTAQSVSELVDPETMRVLYRWQAMSPALTSWSDDNRYLAYVYQDQIYLLNRKNFSIESIAQQLKGVNQIEWFDQQTLILSWHKPEEKPHPFTKHYRGLEDRWSYWRGQSQIYLLDVKSGVTRQLTQNTLGSSLLDFDNQSKKILFTRSPLDYAQPAHYLTQLFELDMNSNQETLLGEYRTFNSAQYGKHGIVMSAGPDLLKGKGSVLQAGIPANNYDTQLYLLNKKRQIEPLSKDFDPAISQFTVLNNGDLLVLGGEGDKKQLFIFDFSKRKFKRQATSLEVIDQFTVSQERRAKIVYSGTNATTPQKTYLAKVGSSKQNLLIDSAKNAYTNTHFVELKEWDYTTSQGTDIDGRYYLPADFDPNKKYPMLVYYYGGTAPVTRAFTGRWPFSLWASQGYVVYVLQPSGTYGYGQKFSAKHVNAWGKHTADDIMQSVQAFTQAHQFVDSQKIGNLGASYGGFMTMYLATQTDMFKASISHAGISNLASYWGYGWWGYAYSGVATKGSFPWNRSDLYTQQSPLFRADKVKTPLLLIHGDADTNVPVSESHQMYTALKLLGQEVDLVEFHGDDHHILGREHQLRWWYTILSYFDKHLKDQPQWWEHLYPPHK